MFVYLDIETIPSQRNDVKDRIWAGVEAPAQYKKPESIEKWLAEHRDDVADERWRRTALDGGYGEVVVIAYAIGDGDVWAGRRAAVTAPEADLLSVFFERLAKACHGQTLTYVGHNIGFDLRFLHHRAVVCGVRPAVHLPYNAAAWQSRYVDTMYEWAGARDSIKLTELCDILGIEAHDEIDGSQVWGAYQGGNVDAVVQHCTADVERVRAVHKRLMWV